ISLDEFLARAPATERLTASVAVGVGALGVVLALVGVHAALAYAVTRRRREIGVRLAVGASPTAVARDIIRQGLFVTGIGVPLGAPVAFFAARSLTSLMYRVSEGDVVTFAVVTVFFLALGAGAGRRI